MKLGVFVDLLKPYVLGGAEKNCYEICKRLATDNQVEVFTIRLKGQPKEERIKGMKIHRLGLPHSLEKRELIPLFSYIFNGFFRGLREDYQVIWGNGFVGSLTAGLVSIVKRKPLVIIIHDVYWDKWCQYVRNPFCRFGKILEKILSKLPFKNLITVSEIVKEKMNQILKIPKEKIKVIPNGIDLKLINSVKAEREENVILSVGRLVGYKNQDHIIKAFAKLKKKYPDLKLKVVGSGPERKELEKLVKKLKIKDIEFLGYLPKYEQVIKELKKATLLVQASQTEGFGIILIEAMSSGCPIVAYDLPVYHRFAEDGRNCLLVEHKVEELTKKMEELLENKRLQESLRKNGYETAKEFGWDKIAKRVEELLEKV